MSTYFVADAINSFEKTFKKSMEERNKIEKDRLEFDKAKFEFYKAFEEEKFKLNNQQLNSDTSPTDHDCNWIVAKAEAVTKEEAGCATYYTQRCSVCGKERIKKVEFDGNHKSNVTIWELKT